MCLDREYGVACGAPYEGTSTGETCSAWLDETQRRPDASAPEVQILIGSAQRAMSAFFSADLETNQLYVGQATATFRQLSDQQPDNASARIGLATLAATPEARLEYLRQAVAIDPSNLRIVDGFVSTLLHLGTPGILDGIDVMQHIYREVDTLDEAARWRLAFSIVVSYRGLGLPQRPELEADLTAFLAEAREDFRWDDMLAEILRAPMVDAGRTAAYLSTMCHRHAHTLFGSTECFDSLTAVAEAAAGSGGSDAGFRLADAVASMMMSVSSFSFLFEGQYPDWHEQFRGLLQSMMSNGIEPPTTFHAYPRFEADPQVRLLTLERGSVLFPQDGNVALALGSEYLIRGRNDEAIVQFHIAREYLPEYAKGGVDNFMRIAHGEMEMPEDWRLQAPGGTPN